MLGLRSIRQRAASRFVNSSTPLSSQIRSLHYVPKLDGGEAKDWQEKGIGKFMTAEQFDIAWTQNQGRLVDRLNSLTDGGPYENSPTKHILLATARDPNYAPHFNHASMAHNNHFFFGTLSPTPTRPSKNFGNDLEICFSSAASFRASFLATAESMFGPGFVWLVQKNDTPNPIHQKYAVLCTYAAGSPYPQAVFRKQDRDVSTSPNGAQTGQGAYSWVQQATVGFARHSNWNVPPGGQDLTPLMCVSTWEHAYLHDYGVGGKRTYLERWWDSIDWNKVEKNAPQTHKTPSSHYG